MLKVCLYCYKRKVKLIGLPVVPVIIFQEKVRFISCIMHRFLENILLFCFPFRLFSEVVDCTFVFSLSATLVCSIRYASEIWQTGNFR